MSRRSSASIAGSSGSTQYPRMWRLAPSYSPRLDPRDELEPGVARGRLRVREASERVVIGEGEALEVLRPREVHHLRGTEGPVGAVRVAVEVVSGHRRERVRPSARSSIDAFLGAARSRGQRDQLPAISATVRHPASAIAFSNSARRISSTLATPASPSAGEAPHDRRPTRTAAAPGDRLEDVRPPAHTAVPRRGCARRPHRPPRGARPRRRTGIHCRPPWFDTTSASTWWSTGGSHPRPSGSPSRGSPPRRVLTHEHQVIHVRFGS